MELDGVLAVKILGLSDSGASGVSILIFGQKPGTRD